MSAIAGESHFQHWEQLVAEGKPPYEAAREAGVTLSALKRGDRERYRSGMALSSERRAAVVERRMDELALAEEPSPQIVTAWAKANHPEAYTEKRRLEISGQVEHEHRGEFTIGQLAALAQQLGVIEQLADGDDRPEAALPAARALPAGPA